MNKYPVFVLESNPSESKQIRRASGAANDVPKKKLIPETCKSSFKRQKKNECILPSAHWFHHFTPSVLPLALATSCHERVARSGETTKTSQWERSHTPWTRTPNLLFCFFNERTNGNQTHLPHEPVFPCLTYMSSTNSLCMYTRQRRFLF